MNRGSNMRKTLKKLFPPASHCQMDEAGERVLKQIRELMPEAVEAFRFRPRRVRAERLRRLDQQVLLAIYLLRGEGRLYTITPRLDDLSGRHYSVAMVSYSIGRLEGMGLISAEFRRDASDGIRREYFKVTEEGELVRSDIVLAGQAIENVRYFA